MDNQTAKDQASIPSSNGQASPAAEPPPTNPSPGPQPPQTMINGTASALPPTSTMGCPEQPQRGRTENWARRPRDARDPLPLRRPAPPKAPEPPLSPTALKVDYFIKITGGPEVVAEVKSCFDFPMALQPECIASTDASFGEVLNRILVQPAEIRVRSFLQKKFEESTAQDTAAQPADPFLEPIKRNDKINLGSAAEFMRQDEERRCPPAKPFDGWPDRLPDPPNKKDVGSGKKSTAINGSGS
jgi:hypothetical protein